MEGSWRLTGSSESSCARGRDNGGWAKRLGLSSLAASSWVSSPGNDVYKGLEIIARAGFTHIEYSDQSRPSFLDSPRDELARIRACADGLGLVLWSAHSPCGMVDLADPDPEKRAEAFDVHCRCLEGLAVLGVPHFVVHQVSAAESDPAERLRVGLSSVMRLRFVAKEFGIRLLVENFTIFDPEDLLDFVDLAGEDGLGVVLDTGHEWQMGRDPAEGIRIAAPHLRSVHLHDNHGEGSIDEHLPPGMGTTDWPAVLDALDEVGYAGPLMMEVIPHVDATKGMSPEELTGTCFDNMRRILAETGRLD